MTTHFFPLAPQACRWVTANRTADQTCQRSTVSTWAPTVHIDKNPKPTIGTAVAEIFAGLPAERELDHART